MVLLVLAGLTASVFSLTFSVKKTEEADMVYCPLSKKLQPVNPPKEVVRQKSLQDICASEQNKNLFARELFKNSFLDLSSQDKNQFENLAFDFFQKGDSVFKNLPHSSDWPSNENLIKNFYASISSASFYNPQSIRTSKVEDFGFSLHPRPPNFSQTARFDFEIVRRLETISRNINPRSPPARLS